MLHLPAVLSADDLARVRALLAEARWVDGRATAGSQSHQVKRNLQAAEDDPAAAQAARVVLEALLRAPGFVSAALPARISPPLFNRYAPSQSYGPHIDGAIRATGADTRMRTDLSATLFLADPGDYDGGELVIRGREGVQRVKLPAGDLVLYDASTIHDVEPVVEGVRVASFFWVQSLVRRSEERTMLFELDGAIQQLSARLPDDPALLTLTAHYHNLLRLWAQV